MATMQDVLNLARTPLNDADPVDANRRYPDSELIKFANNLVLQAFRNRPDIFIGTYTTPPSLTMTGGSAFPMPDEYLQVIADGVTFRAETKDDDKVKSGRASAFEALFGKVIP